MRIPLDTRANWIAVLGAAKQFEPFQLELGYRVGTAVARAKKGLLTGATMGVPLAAAIGAKDHGGQVLGISPAENPAEHTTHFSKPLAFHDTIVFTGLGNDGRSPVIVRSAGIAVFVGGEAGTLQEFSAAWLNGTPIIGILEKSGGIADTLRAIANSFNTSFGSQVLASDSPEELVALCLAKLNELKRSLPGTDGDDPTATPVLAFLQHVRPPRGARP